jgi:hypothetical protein
MTSPSGSTAPWRVHFFERHPDDDPDRAVPAHEFLTSVSLEVRAKIFAALNAVADAPPPQFSGGGKWQAMHGKMAGIYEIRVSGDGRNHRLFCVLDTPGTDLGGPSIVCISGLSKPLRSAAADKDYARALSLAAEFRSRRTISR